MKFNVKLVTIALAGLATALPPSLCAAQTYLYRQIAAGLVSPKVAVSLSDAAPTMATVGAAYSFNLGTSLKTSKVVAPGDITWSATGLPAGLQLGASGVISGVPTADYPTGATVRVSAAHADSTATHDYVVTVQSIGLALAPTGLPAATVGTAYSFNFAPHLSTVRAMESGAITWSAANLPPGLSLSSAGLLSGVPSVVQAAGTSFQVSVSHFSSSTTTSYSLTVNDIVYPAGYYKTGALVISPLIGSLKVWQAGAWCAGNPPVAGQSGWRLPTLAELQSIQANKPTGWNFSNVVWSSEATSPWSGRSYTVSLQTGGVGSQDNAYNEMFFCVKPGA